jgi:peptidyl-prolyl cis-trans isomerase D
MSNQTRKPPPLTKKHLARLERERLQRRWIIIGVTVVGVLVVGLIAFGIIQQNVIQPNQPVAQINGDKISVTEFQRQAKLSRYFLIQNAVQTYQFAQQFNDPQFQSQFVSQLQQIQSQLTPSLLGQQVLDYLESDRLIRQEAAKRGITVPPSEVDQAYQAWFDYYPAGTPTPTAIFEPKPTSTLTSLQQTLVPPTATPTATPEITTTVAVTGSLAETVTPTVEFTPTPTGPITPTVTPFPTPTATPFTEQAFKDKSANLLSDLKQAAGLNESDFRQAFIAQAYRNKLQDQVTADLKPEQEQVWARHILVADEQAAKDIEAKLKAGEDFCALAAANSTDTSNKDKCGDLGWFAKGAMVKEFEDAAFALGIGETSQPVQTQFGWHIIQVLGHENRPLSSAEFDQLRQTKFQEFLTQLKDQATIVTNDNWVTLVPQTPALPQALIDYIQNASQSAAPTTPPIILATPTP